MKKLRLFATVSAVVLSITGALAADLPSRKAPPILPPPPPPPPMWTGFYVGLNAGGTWGSSNHQSIIVAPTAVAPGFGLFTPNAVNPFFGNNFTGAFAAAATVSGINNGNNGGFIGGGQIGYNWQFYNNFVVGAEADIQGIAGNHRNRTFTTVVPVGVDFLGNSSNFVGFHSVNASLDYIGTVRGRLGWLFTPTLLLYGTGGLAYGGVTLNTSSFIYNNFYLNQFDGQGNAFLPAAIGGVNFSNTLVGWTAGGGLEWMFWPNWSAKVEYLYYDLGNVNQNFVVATTDVFGASAAFAGQARVRANGNIVRGLSGCRGFFAPRK